MKTKEGLTIDDRRDAFTPDYLSKKSTQEQYEEYCKNNPLKDGESNKTKTA